MQYLTALSALVGLALAAGRTSAPDGALVVGSGADYTTIQDAVNALSTSSSDEQSIFIQAGTYKEQVYIKALSGPLTIYGYTTDTSSYANNNVTITYGLGLSDVDNDDETATLRVWTSDFKLYNVNVENSYGEGSQALALSANAKNQGYYACKFLGFQDTILANTGAQLYAKSYISGATDFIFGLYAAAWFEQVDLRLLSASLGYITASGRSSADNSYYVINNSTVAAASGEAVDSGAFYLGRPWRDYARVVFQDTSMTDVINSAGWAEWSTSEPNTDHVTFAEYGNTGAGSKGTRASFATTLSEPVAISDVLGSNYTSASWVDTAYMA
ncbi:carbohydrate esterase family 8 [Lecanosticta acicola]|uniref:Pectinesterase n=1 Tax=Lecanosticta acicola TaxID=111012 RepID=A0AAI8Z465_9PEZI|nr:carbohydrate esterase family 8 [Lecanosticta acicola]